MGCRAGETFRQQCRGDGEAGLFRRNREKRGGVEVADAISQEVSNGNGASIRRRRVWVKTRSSLREGKRTRGQEAKRGFVLSPSLSLSPFQGESHGVQFERAQPLESLGRQTPNPGPPKFRRRSRLVLAGEMPSRFPLLPRAPRAGTALGSSWVFYPDRGCQWKGHHPRARGLPPSTLHPCSALTPPFACCLL